MSASAVLADAPATFPADVLPLDLYIRVSSVNGRGGDSFRSPAEQEADGRAMCARLRRPVGEVIVDLDASAGNQDRVGLELVLERIRAGLSGGVVVYKLDRLSREDAGAVERLLIEIEDAGGKVHAPDLPDDFRSASGELQLGLIATVNRYARSQARERFDSAKRGAIARGIPVLIRTPVGYLQGEDRRLVVDPQWSPGIIEARELAAQGMGLAALARWLNAEGIPPRTDGRCSGPKLDASGEVVMGRKRPKVCGGDIGDDGHCATCGRPAPLWQRQTVAAMLENRVYLGEVSYGPYTNPNAHEPLCDLPTFIAALAPRPAEAMIPREGAKPFMLSGVAVCAGCGYRLSGSQNGRGQRSYVCVGHHASGACPNPMHLKAEWLDAAVEAAYLAPLDEAEIIAHSAPALNMEDLTAKLATAERRFEQVRKPESVDALGDAWPATVAEYRAARDAAAQALGEARAANVAADRRVDPEEAREQWAELDTVGRREALRGFYQAVAVRRTPGGVVAQLWTHDDVPPAPLRQRFPDEADAALMGVGLEAVTGQLPADVDPVELAA